MSTPSMGTEALDRSIHHANAWLTDLETQLGEDRQSSYRALRAFLHTLRERLTLEEAADLAAQLPHLWRGVFYEGFKPSRPQETYRDRDAFLQRLAQEGQLAGVTEASLTAEACAKVLRKHIAEGEFQHVVGMLPGALVPLFEPSA